MTEKQQGNLDYTDLYDKMCIRDSHRINRLTIEYFGGTYTVISNLKEEPAIIITYTYSKLRAEDAV